MEMRAIVERFHASGDIVRIRREHLEESYVEGYLAGCGPEWFAVEAFDDAARLNGFCCMRYADVSECDAAPHAAFKEKALVARRTSRSDFVLDLSSLANLIRSAGAAYPLVTLHGEDANENYCYIGRILSVTERNVRYLYISPGAEWAAEPELFALEAISGVDVGGAYEEALFLVGGRN